MLLVNGAGKQNGWKEKGEKSEVSITVLHIGCFFRRRLAAASAALPWAGPTFCEKGETIWGLRDLGAFFLIYIYIYLSREINLKTEIFDGDVLERIRTRIQVYGSGFMLNYSLNHST